MKKNYNKHKTAAALAVIMSMAVVVGPVAAVSAQETGIMAQESHPGAIAKQADSPSENEPATNNNSEENTVDLNNTPVNVVAAQPNADANENSAGASNAAAVDITIDETTFPDENFRNWILAQTYGTDGKLTPTEIGTVTTIEIQNKKITNLKGIEYFTALTTLDCSDNKLTTLDVSKNTALIELSCGANQLTELDISKNTALTKLYCDNNQLTALDVSNNTFLTLLDCKVNLLTALDVSNNTALIELSCDTNQLIALDVSKNTALTQLYCDNNQLTALDVSENTALTGLQCSNNPLNTLDVSKNIALTKLECSNNKLTTLDVSKNTALKLLNCDNNQLTELDVSKNTALTHLWCSSNQLTELNVEKNTALTQLECSSNQLTKLDVSKNILLTLLKCHANQLTELDVSKNTALTYLDSSNNKLICLILQNPDSLTSSVFAAQDVNTITATTTFDLATLAPSIDSSKITELKGATLTGTTLSAFTVGNNITYKYKANDNKTLDVTIKVAQANSWTTPLSIENWKYGETPKAPIAVAAHGTPKFVYSNAENGTYTDAVPTNAGTWYVKAIVDATDGYLGLESAPVSFEITKAPVTETEIKVPTITPDEKVLYGQTLADIKLPNGWIWVEPTTVVTVNNSGYAARLAVDDANYDYTGIDGYVGDVTTFSAAPTSHYVERKIIVAVAQAPAPAITEPTELTTTTGNTLAQITLPEGWSWTDNTQVVATGTNGYTAKLAVDDTNYDYKGVPGYNAEGHYVARTLTVQGTAAPNGGGTAEPGGNPGNDQDNSNQNINNLDDTNAGNNVKTGDSTASIAGGLSIAAILSACTAWFVSKKKRKID